jgi:predicted metal-dependent enzyme (double-stranded beta helix superfamily)
MVATLETPLSRRSTSLDSFVANMDHVVVMEPDPHTIAAEAAALLEPALRDPRLLERRHCEPYEDRYRQHIVHVHPEGKYSIVALVWKPGHATPIHDHRCWCVVGVWRGIERETTYDLHKDVEREWLVIRGSSISQPGDVSALVPPAEDIHKVENSGDSLAISVHVYGANIAELGSSINEVFEQPVRRRDSAGRGAVAWRSPQHVDAAG